VFPGWSEATTLNATGTTSSWVNSAAVQTTAFGSNTIKINLLGATKKDWVICQPLIPVQNSVLRFKTAVTNAAAITPDSMGTDDSLVVKVTTNCGQSWTPIGSFTEADQLSNQLTSFSFPIGQFAGQNIRIGFFATEGSVDDLNSFDLHLDDVEVYVPSSNDLGLQTILLPNPICGASASLDLRVRVINNGTQPQSSISVSYSVNGQTPVNQVFAQTLATGETADFTFSTPVQFNSQGNYLISAWTNLPGDQNAQNDTLKVTINKTGPTFSTVNFTGFTGANLATVFPGWREQNGLSPIGTTSSWTVSSAAQTTFFGSASARVNLTGATKKDWIISPAIVPEGGYVLKFKTAVTTLGNTATSNMGFDDSLIVKVSTNCGQTWSRIRSWTSTSGLTNQLAEQIVPISDFAGQNILIAFYATEGSVNNGVSYDLHIDDIELVLPIANDLGVSDIVFPAGGCAAPASLSLTVRVTNYGFESQTNFPVNFKLDNQAIVTENFSGTLAAGQTASFTFPQVLDLSAAGTYNFSAWTSLANDGNISNDSVADKQIARPENILVTVDFNFFNGTNLETNYPGWYEAVGQAPQPNPVSTWVNSTGSQTTAFGTQTARVNLNSNFKRHWMISPVFSPFQQSVLHFKAAVTNRNFALNSQMGADDSVNVMVTTNCGTSWSLLKSFTVADNLTNQLQDFALPLSQFASQALRIGFFATDGAVDNTQDFDFHVDNIYVSVTTSLIETEAAAFNIYPNPSGGRFNLTLPTPASDSDFIQIFGLDGRQKSEKINLQTGAGFQNLEVQDLAEGIYILRISTSGKQFVKPLVIRK
jgi:hypothetical protein